MLTPETFTKVDFLDKPPVNGGRRVVTVIYHRQLPVHNEVGASKVLAALGPSSHYEGGRLFTPDASPPLGHVIMELRQKVMR